MTPDQKVGTVVGTHGYKFQWTDLHPSINDVQKMLHTYDKLANDVLDRLDELSPPTDQPPKGCPMHSRDMYSLVKQYADSDKTVGKLWEQVTEVPDWVDWEQIRRGQKLVYQYHTQIQLSVSPILFTLNLYKTDASQLLFTSLVGGAGAWRIAETLSRTGGFGVHVSRRRLLETLQHFVQVVESLDSVKPDGEGFVSSIRVRLLHAKVRRRIMHLEETHPGYYNSKEWGVPINDLHQVATIMAYSASVVFVSLPRVGVHCTEQQIADYLALWRWVGYIMGTPVDWMTTPETAKAMMETIMLSEVKPSTKSQVIANNILTAQTGFPPLYASRNLLAALAYRYNGQDLAKALNIEEPSGWYRGLAVVLGATVNLLSSTYEMVPKWWQARRDEVRCFTLHLHCSLMSSSDANPI